MRKITEDAVRAFLNGESFKRDNTTVEVMSKPNETVLKLHGHIIASRLNGTVRLNHCGWETNTTKERLNGVLDFMGRAKIYQRDFVWYWKDGEEFKDGWNEVK